MLIRPKLFVVFDLDGTLADTTHRTHFITGEKKDWGAFFDACVDDKPIWPAIETYNALSRAGHMVSIWTGRSDQVRTETLAWLYELGLASPYVFLMRGATDRTDDHILKKQWMQQYCRPDLVFEDRQRVVDMWRENGVPCFQVAPGDF